MMKLRDYQTRSIEMLMSWMRDNRSGHPVVNLPGGSGKSVVIASLAADAVRKWPHTRVLMLVHSKELIAQNASKLLAVWPEAPMGIYSASIGQRVIDKITYAGIGSVRNRAQEIGFINLLIVDEVHAVSANESGTYRKLISELLKINPTMRIVGFTASPYRLGHGMITEGKDAIFTDIIEPVSIMELVAGGYLLPLRSKSTVHKLSSEGLHKRQGEFIASEMEAKFNTQEHNAAVADEVIEKAADRKHILVFCSGIDHSESVAAEFRERGITAVSLTSTASKQERESILADFESGVIRVVCNVGILTTGYDFPALDCIVFLRSTMSPGLYLQMAVRGMRVAEGKTDCLVMDFAGNVSTHGPVTDVQPPAKKGDGTGEAPIKVCDCCGEIVHLSVKVCPSCGTPFPEPVAKKLNLDEETDIMGVSEKHIKTWIWRTHTSKASGKDMLKVNYYKGLTGKPVVEYFPVTHDGAAGNGARHRMMDVAKSSGVVLFGTESLMTIVAKMNQGRCPDYICVRREGNYDRVIARRWA